LAAGLGKRASSVLASWIVHSYGLVVIASSLRLCIQGRGNLFQVIALFVYYVEHSLDSRLGPTMLSDPALRGLQYVIRAQKPLYE